MPDTKIKRSPRSTPYARMGTEEKAAMIDAAARLMVAHRKIHGYDCTMIQALTLARDIMRGSNPTPSDKTLANLGPRVKARLQDFSQGPDFGALDGSALLRSLGLSDNMKLFLGNEELQVPPQPVEANTSEAPVAQCQETLTAVSPTALLASDKLAELQVDFSAQITSLVSNFVSQVFEHVQAQVQHQTEELLLRNVSSVQDLMRDALSRAALGAMPPQAAEPAKAKVALSRVVILGLKGGQTELIRDEYRDKFYIRGETAESSAGISKNALRRYDYVLLMGNWSDHSTQYRFDDHPGFRIVKGGMTTLRHTLDSLLENAHG